MTKDITRTFSSQQEAKKFFSDYSAVWQTVGENYTAPGLSSSVIQEGIKLAAINVLDNPELFEKFKGLTPMQYSAEVKLEISRILAQISPSDSERFMPN